MQCDRRNIATNEIRQLVTGALPASDPWRKNNAIMTSKRRRFDVAFTLLLQLSAGLPGKA